MVFKNVRPFAKKVHGGGASGGFGGGTAYAAGIFPIDRQQRVHRVAAGGAGGGFFLVFSQQPLFFASLFSCTRRHGNQTWHGDHTLKFNRAIQPPSLVASSSAKRKKPQMPRFDTPPTQYRLTTPCTTQISKKLAQHFFSSEQMSIYNISF